MNDVLGWSANAIALATLIYTFLSARQKAAAHKVAAIDHNLGELDKRVTRIEVDMRHLPEPGEFHRLEKSLLEMRADVAVIAERLKPVSETSRRLQEAILERAERGGV